MVSRIIVPVVDQTGLDSSLAEHFGRAPFYAIVDLEDNDEIGSVKTVPNVSEHAGGRGFSHDHVLGLKPDAIVVYGMGPRGLNTFKAGGVCVLKANADTLKEVISAYTEDKLQEVTSGCENAHHH